MRFLRQSLTGLFLVSLTLGILAMAGFTIFSAVQERLTSKPHIPERRERIFAVNVITAVEQENTPVLQAFGEIESRRTLEIRSKLGGTLIWLAEEFEEGGQVQVGQLLARIDPADAQSALDRAQSDLLDARAETREADRALSLARDELTAAQEQVELRERAYRRQQELEERGVGTTAAIETAELATAQARQQVLGNRQALALAEARVDQAATRLARAGIVRDEAKRRLDDTSITAGFTGTLSDVTVVEGRLVSASEKLAHLVDGDKLEVAFRVSTPQYLRLLNEEGTLIRAPVSATLDVYGLDLEARGKISRDSAVVGEGQTGRLIFARLATAPGFKPGDFVTVTVKEPPLARSVRLPASSLGPAGKVLILGKDDRLEALEVELLRRQGDDILVRGEGLAGREVVTKRSPLLGGGIRVRPLRQADEATTARDEMLELSDDRRARLLAFVEGVADMPEAVKTQLLSQLKQPRVPARMVRRLETRMGG